jgi:sporulation protein YlmC with PRC-barrel domain
MRRQELHLELLLGKQVFALNGKPIGRLEEVRAELNNRGHCFVSEFLIGSYAVLERLSVWRIGRAILHTLHVRNNGYRVPWDQLDLSDPQRPQLKCELDDLMKLI